MTSVAKAAIKAEIEWASSAAGILTVAVDDADVTGGVIAANDADLAAGVIPTGDWTATFGGVYDNVSARVRRASVSRGRNSRLDEMSAGSGTLDLRDHTGIFNPANPTSPLAGAIESRLHPARLTWIVGGIETPLFSGWARHIAWEPTGRRGVAQIELVDLFYWIEGSFPTIVATGPTTTGAAIGLLLDAISWLEPEARSLDVGDSIPDFVADGSRSALSLIGELLEAERGVFYISAGGVATYEDRHARASRSSSGTIADRMSRIVGSVDFDLVYNRVLVERTQTSYVAEAIDSASRSPATGVGPSDLPKITTPYLESDAQAENLADWILPIVVSPKPPIRSLRIDHRDADLLTQIVTRELVDRVTIQEGEGGTDGDYHVERMEIRIEAQPVRKISADWLLSQASVAPYLLIAASDADAMSGSVAVDDADVAAGVIVY